MEYLHPVSIFFILVAVAFVIGAFYIAKEINKDKS